MTKTTTTILPSSSSDSLLFVPPSSNRTVEVETQQQYYGGEGSSYLAQELKSAKQTLALLEAKEQKRLLRQQQRQQQQQQRHNDDDDDDEGAFDFDATTASSSSPSSSSTTSILNRLLRLQQTTDTLEVAQDFIEFLRQAEETISLLGQRNNNSDDDDDIVVETVLIQSQMCQSFAEKVLLKHYNDDNSNSNKNNTTVSSVLDVYPSLYEDMYVPFYRYVHEYLVTLLRKALHTARYPQPQGCERLLLVPNHQPLLRQQQQQQQHDGQSSHFLQICSSLRRLERIHQQVLEVLGVEWDGRSGSEGIVQQQQQQPSTTTTTMDTVLLELFHPLLDRVHFHFVDTGGGSGSDGTPATTTTTPARPRLTVTRIDRLPEWLLTYVRDNFLQTQRSYNSGTCSPYDVIMAIDPLLIVPYLNEIVKLIGWTIQDQRRFFHHPSIVGPQSNPQLLNDAIQQFIQFDRTIQELLVIAADSVVTTTTTTTTSISTMDGRYQQQPYNRRIVGLMDVMVASNDELMNWWIEREKESVFGTLFPEDDDNNVENTTYKYDQPMSSTSTGTTTCSLTNHVSGRAELFCAIIRSIQYKADTLSSSSKYIRHVAVPLCSQFLDAVHETSRVLLKQLVQNTDQRGNVGTTSSARPSKRIASHHHLFVNVIHSWIELVNGTQLAARVLLTKERTWYAHRHNDNADGTNINHQSTPSTVGTGGYPSSDHDLARLGRSMGRLAEAMIDDFVSTFVEVVLMERARLASYLMMASHLLASQEWETDTAGTMTDGDDDEEELSVELRDTKKLIQDFLKVCNSIVMGPNGTGGGGQQECLLRSTAGPSDDDDGAHHGVALFAPLALRQHVMNSVANKFLEVALDWNHLTPEMWYTGAKIFARDVQNVLGLSSSSSKSSPPWQLGIGAVHRLIGVTKLMTVTYKGLEGLRAALSGLVGTTTTEMDDDDYNFLVLDDFMADSTIHEEAVSMLKAKHLDCPLVDAISILNRRRS